MRSVDSNLLAHLDTGATTLATCWRIARRDGVVLGFTDHDRALTFDETTFLPETGAVGSALSSSADLAADNAEIEGALSASALSGEDLAAGKYDGAEVEIFRVNWAAPDQRLLLKKGVIGEVTRVGEAFRAELRGLSHKLEQPIGRVYQRLCDVNVGSAKCGVDLDQAAFKTSGAVTALRDAQSFTASGFSSFEDGWFAHGLLTWTAGANVGLSAHVKTQTQSGAISLWLPAGAAIEVGDAFTVTAGCDKRFETCRAKFSNAANFRGFPFMPGNDFAVSYPLKGEKNTGGKLK
ncbi:MAG: beta tubulin [Parvularcula sp.]|nr:beta tubulin [Parvularcula sp.]